MSPPVGASDHGGTWSATEGGEMTATANRIRPIEPGDVVEISGRHVGDAGRTGEIVAVLGEEDHAHYRVCWEDGRESILYPGEGTTIRSGEGAFVSAD